MNLTVGELRKMIEGVPDNTEIAIQELHDQSMAFMLDKANVDMWGETLVLAHSCNGELLQAEEYTNPTRRRNADSSN